jgi:hypothetical protein
MVVLIPIAFGGVLFIWVLAGAVCETNDCHGNPGAIEFAIWALGGTCVLVSQWLSKRKLWLGLATVALFVPVVHLLPTLGS